jgi:hypothetical protein
MLLEVDFTYCSWIAADEINFKKDLDRQEYNHL